MEIQHTHTSIKHMPGLYEGKYEIAYTMMPPRVGLKKLRAGLQKEFPWLDIQTVKRIKGGFEVHAVATETSYAPIPSYWDNKGDDMFYSWGVKLFIDNYKPEPRPVYTIHFPYEKLNSQLYHHIAECYELPFKVEAQWGIEEIDSLKTFLLDYQVKAAEYRETHPEWLDPEWNIEWFCI